LFSNLHFLAYFIMELLRQVFQHQAPISTQDWASLRQHWTHEKTLQRKEYLSDIGSIGKHLYWVLEGTLKICALNQGEETCVGFAYPNTVACAYPSFISNQPTDYYIQAITPCRLVGISRDDFYRTIEQSIQLERAWRKLTEQALLGRMSREIYLSNPNPQERFLGLWERSPHLFQLFPQRYIASYLQMSAETFSRIKSKVWKR